MATQTLRSTAASSRLKGKVAIITGGDQSITSSMISYHRRPPGHNELKRFRSEATLLQPGVTAGRWTAPLDSGCRIADRHAVATGGVPVRSGSGCFRTGFDIPESCANGFEQEFVIERLA